jgi:hypothetical protein
MHRQSLSGPIEKGTKRRLFSVHISFLEIVSSAYIRTLHRHMFTCSYQLSRITSFSPNPDCRIDTNTWNPGLWAFTRRHRIRYITIWCMGYYVPYIVQICGHWPMARQDSRKHTGSLSLINQYREPYWVVNQLNIQMSISDQHPILKTVCKM